MNVKQKRTQAERSEATRSALMGAARPLFIERGYADVGAEEIVRAAGVTRGALYHHFGGKVELFDAVYVEVEGEVTQRVAEGVSFLSGDPVAEMKAGLEMFLQVISEPGLQRIILIDAPAVLGWERWRAIGLQHGLGLIEAVLTAAMESGHLAEAPVRPLAHILLGALDEAALMIVRSDEPDRIRAEVVGIFDPLIDGLRPR